MLYLNIFFKLPLDIWKMLYSWNKMVSKNKSIEFNIYRSSSIFLTKFEISTRCDHAGFNIEFGFLFHEFEFNFYDIRHWDDEENKWEEYE